MPEAAAQIVADHAIFLSGFMEGLYRRISELAEPNDAISAMSELTAHMFDLTVRKIEDVKGVSMDVATVVAARDLTHRCYVVSSKRS